MSIDRLEAELLELPQQDRARLARTLLDSLGEVEEDESVHEQWIKEAHRRYAELESGMATGVSAEDALRRARERIE